MSWKPSPDIPPCVILPRRDDMRGHHLIAVIEGAENKCIRATLLDHCKTNGLLAPREIVFLDKLPLLPSSKPDLQRTAILIGVPQ
jgi:long-chain acyl-CoA synthetase